MPTSRALADPGCLALPGPKQAKLSALMDAAVNVLPKIYHPDCCIAATRILCRVCAKLNTLCRPVSVRVDIFNPAMALRLATNGRRCPETTEEYNQWTAEDGSWWMSGGVDQPDEEGPFWKGHLVSLLWDSILVDLTTAQWNRPQRGIHMHAVAGRISPTWPAGGEQAGVVVNHSLVLYESKPEDHSYVTAGDWWNPAKSEEATRLILRRIRAEIRD